MTNGCKERRSSKIARSRIGTSIEKLSSNDNIENNPRNSQAGIFFALSRAVSNLKEDILSKFILSRLQDLL